MSLTLTEHAKMRQRQRGFSNLSLDILEQFARRKHAAGGAKELFFGKREAIRASQEFKKLIQVLDKVNGSSIVILDNYVLTMYKN